MEIVSKIDSTMSTRIISIIVKPSVAFSLSIDYLDSGAIGAAAL